MSLFLVTCSDMGESTHVLAVFPTEAAANTFKAAPHNETACPRSWAYKSFSLSEAEASLLTGVGAARPADAEERHTSHELDVVRMPLEGAREAGEDSAWVVFPHSFHVGSSFDADVARAFTTKARAMRYLCLPATSVMPNLGGGAESPLNRRFGGEAVCLCRAYPVTGWGAT